MKRSLLSMIIPVMLIMPGIFAFAQDLEFQEALTFTIPGISDISEFHFYDIDYDDMFEVLARCGNTVLVYSISYDSILFATDIDTAAYRMIEFADINRDSIADIAVACFHDCRDHSDSAFTIDLYDGAAGYLPTRRYYPNAERSYGLWLIYSASLASFTALDVNRDGYDELFISYCNWIWDGGPGPPAHIWTEYQYAFGKLYYSYPDSLIWTNGERMINARMVEDSDASFMMANGLLNEAYDFGTERYIGRSSVIRFDTNNVDFYTFSDDALALSRDKQYCERTHSYQSLLMKCAGDLITSNSEREFLATFSFLWDCWNPMEFPEVIDSQGKEIRMYRMPSPDSAEMVWVKEYGVFGDYVFLPDYPGYYFAFSNDRFIQFNGNDGSEFRSTTQIPAGIRKWDYPYDDGKPYLVTLNSNVVTIYEPVVFTAVDGGEDRPLPTALSLGRPYPNPFNAVQTIPVTSKPGRPLTVDIYNLLGQRVDRLFDGRVTSGNANVRWQADNLPSGVYFIRASSDAESVVVRSILLK